MTVLYIDTEHEHVRADGIHSSYHQAKVEQARLRLIAAAGEPCLALHFSEVSLSQLEPIGPTAIVLSGNTTDWQQYDFKTLEPLLEIIRAAPMPILGICAGHQLIGFAHGAAWDALGRLQEGEIDPDPSFAPGQRKQRGFMPVQLDSACQLFHGLADTAHFFQSHYWQLTGVPTGFIARASSVWSPIQAIERLDRLVFGVQFHPERYDANHLDGHAVLCNFFALTRSRH